MTDGLVVVDKPAGWTSHDVVARLRRVYGQRRVGHAGTLDPDATGVLLVGLGRVTRLLRFVQAQNKEYRGVVRFGVATTTQDAAGDVVEHRAMPVTRDEVEAATKSLTGWIDQVPPMVSAVKIDGRRLYEAARAGEEVDRPSRRVRVDRFDVVGFDAGEQPRAAIVVECTTGTYIRTLAVDLGAALGGPAHLAELRRTRIGSFPITDARTLDVIERDPGGVVLSPAAAMRDLDQVVVDDERGRAVRHGAVLPCRDLGGDGDGPVAVLDADGALLAVYERGRVAAKPAVVLAEP